MHRLQIEVTKENLSFYNRLIKRHLWSRQSVFSFRDEISSYGHTYNISDFHGRIRIVNFLLPQLIGLQLIWL